MEKSKQKLQMATFGGGCFWCTEAIFQKLKGVTLVESGYAGGKRPHPTYEQVSTGVTGHAEVVRISFDPSQISYQTLLEIFWHTHNPTTPNQQGADIGSQYRSVIFYHNEQQKLEAEAFKQELGKAHEYSDPIITQIEPLDQFYPAEDYHQNYYLSNTDKPYCSIVIEPKLQKLMEKYSNRLK